MTYKVASSIAEILSSWCLVYKQYMAASLISPNKMSIFTFPEYISNNTAVIYGTKMNHTVCTVSAVLDSEKGLPLDSHYREELSRLRDKNSRMIEIGLLADARNTSNLTNITELMAGIARFGVYSDHHDYVIGVHPRRVNFFRQIFGFNPIGDVKYYDRLKTAPVVLMYANGKALETLSLKTTSAIYNDPKGFDFDKRFKFNPENFITPFEFSETIDNFIKNVWNPPALQNV